MPTGIVEAIWIGPSEGGPLRSVADAVAEPGHGLVGDRYHAKAKKPGDEGRGQELTLIEAEAIEAFEQSLGQPLEASEARRNVVVRGLDLNAGVGLRLRIGAVLIEATELCHPCNYLKKLTGKDVLTGLRNRGGLRAAILEGGTIHVGDAVEILANPTQPETLP